MKLLTPVSFITASALVASERSAEDENKEVVDNFIATCVAACKNQKGKSSPEREACQDQFCTEELALQILQGIRDAELESRSPSSEKAEKFVKSKKTKKH